MPDRTVAHSQPGPLNQGFSTHGRAADKRPAVDAGDPEPCSRDLTRRERTVLRLLVDGRRNLEISEELGISERTVKFHVRGLFTKFGVSSRTQVVSHALKQGLI